MSAQKPIRSLLKSNLASTIALLLVFLLLSGCSTYATNRHGYSYGHHGSVSVGAQGSASGAAVLGALIVGGIVGSMISDAENEREKESTGLQRNSSTSEENPRDKQMDELVNGYSIGSSGSDPRVKVDVEVDPPNEEQPTVDSNMGQMQWFQYGKNGLCYQMSVNAGVTDVVSEVDESNCQPSNP